MIVKNCLCQRKVNFAIKDDYNSHLDGLEDVLADEKDADEEDEEDAGDLVVESVGEVVGRNRRVENVLGELDDQVGVHPATVRAREVRPERVSVRALLCVRVPARPAVRVVCFKFRVRCSL